MRDVILPFAILLALLLAVPSTVQAELPMPLFPECGEPDQPELCPDDLVEWWPAMSYVRDEWRDNVREEEHAIGTGCWGDRAWRTTTGRTDVVIAVLDSGIMWDDTNLIHKHYLHTPELPLPQDAGGLDAATHDYNGDGVINIRDYADDPRVSMEDGQDYADHMLDPSDLIAVFSDGTDADGNGYIDDIAGWDFFWNDNDPYDDTRFDHGNWEAELALAEGNDGGNDVGLCPNCMLINVRVGDSFVCDVTNFANGLLYAVDMGVEVVIEALGTLNNTGQAIQAIDYAWDAGVIVLASAADEAAYHHNYPANNDHVLCTHAIVNDDDEESDSTTFLNFANCTNYGGRLDLSVGTWGCSSAAVGIGGGIAGLVYSRALDIDLEPPLSASEVYQIMIQAVDDVDVPESWTDPEKYPSKAGWDPHFGYGRSNAYKAVELVGPDTIPPEVDLRTPTWFETVDPVLTPTLDIEGIVDARRSSSVSWTLEIAVGIHPDDGDYQTVATGSDKGADARVLGTVDLAGLALDAEAPFGPYTLEDDDWSKYMKVNGKTVTLRLRAVDGDGNTGEMRKVFYVHRDPDLLPGFPFRTVASMESSPVAVDFEGDGRDEVFYVTADGQAHVCDVTTEGLIPRDGWPQPLALQDEADPDHPANHLDQDAWASGAVSSDARHTVMGAAAFGDLDGDSMYEIVVASMNGQIMVWNHDGTVVDGWPLMLPTDTIPYTEPGFELDYGAFAAPVLEDIDLDGSFEVIVSAMDQHMHVYRADGSVQPGWPVLMRHVNQSGESEGKRSITTPAVGDLDGDGSPDIVGCTNEEPGSSTRYSVAYALHADGNDHDGGAYHEGYPIYANGAYNGDLLPYVGEGAPASPAVGDVDGDGSLELAFFSIGDSGYLYNGDGSEFLKLDNLAGDFGSNSNTIEEAFSLASINSPSFADLNGDGTLDLTMGSVGWAFAEGQLDGGRRHDHDHMLSVWDGSDGQFFKGFPQRMEDMQFFMNPVIADLDGDGQPEVINGSGGFMLHAFNIDGDEPEGWPKFTGQWLLGSPALGDVDGDGFLDLVMGTRSGWIFAWKAPVPVREADIQWANMHHDLRNTRNYHTPLPEYPEIQEGDDDDSAGGDDDGCKCAKTDDGGSAGPLVLLAALAVFSVRRRRR